MQSKKDAVVSGADIKTFVERLDARQEGDWGREPYEGIFGSEKGVSKGPPETMARANSSTPMPRS